MPAPGRQDDEVSGGERDLVRLAIDLEPAGAIGDDVESGMPTGHDTEAHGAPMTERQ
jgi:hypothetical protein